MEPEGITKFCARKVRMKSPTTSTEQMLATASNGVSSTSSAAGAGACGSSALEAVFFLFVILSLCAGMRANLLDRDQ